MYSKFPQSLRGSLFSRGLPLTPAGCFAAKLTEERLEIYGRKNKTNIYAGDSAGKEANCF